MILKPSRMTCAKRVAYLESYLTNDPLATPSGHALFSWLQQRQIVSFKALIDEYDLSHMPRS